MPSVETKSEQRAILQGDRDPERREQQGHVRSAAQRSVGDRSMITRSRPMTTANGAQTGQGSPLRQQN